MRIILVCIISLLSFSTFAATAEKDGFNYLVSVGLTTGGETLAELNTGGKLKSGGLMYVSFGTLYEFPDNPFQIQASLGYHFDTLNADNGTASFDRTFFEILPFYEVDSRTRVGLGIVRILSADYSDPFGDLGFENSTGIIAEVDWRLAKGIWWGVRYVDIEYVVNSINGINPGSAVRPIDGNYFGFMLDFAF